MIRNMDFHFFTATFQTSSYIDSVAPYIKITACSSSNNRPRMDSNAYMPRLLSDCTLLIINTSNSIINFMIICSISFLNPDFIRLKTYTCYSICSTITSIKFGIKVCCLFIYCCVSQLSSYSFKPLVDRAVKPEGISYSNLPIFDALVPSEDIAVVPKYPLPKLY